MSKSQIDKHDIPVITIALLVIGMFIWWGTTGFSLPNLSVNGISLWWIIIPALIALLLWFLQPKEKEKKKERSTTIEKALTNITALAVTAAAIIGVIFLYQWMMRANIRDINNPGPAIIAQREARAEQKAEREKNAQTKPPKGHNFPLNETVLFQKGVSYRFTRGINTALCFDPSDHTVRINVENGNLGWTLWFDTSKNTHFENFKDNPAIIEGWSFTVDKDVYMRLYWY